MTHRDPFRSAPNFRVTTGRPGHFAPMRRVVAPAELDPQVTDCGVSATVVVQSANERSDTDAMLEHANATSWIAGVVAWVPLMDPPAAAAELDRLCEDDHVRG